MDLLELLKPLGSAGALGAVLWWFMTHHTRQLELHRSQLEKLGQRMDQNTRSTLILTLSLPSTPEGAKRACRDLLREVEEHPRGRAEEVA